MQESGCECVLGMRERVKVGEGFEGTCKCEPVCVFVGAGLVRVTAYECGWVGVCVCVGVWVCVCGGGGGGSGRRWKRCHVRMMVCAVVRMCECECAFVSNGLGSCQ